MPIMIRPNKKATKIAFKILGVPANLAYKRSPEERKIDKKLLFEATALVR